MWSQIFEKVALFVHKITLKKKCYFNFLIFFCDFTYFALFI